MLGFFALALALTWPLQITAQLVPAVWLPCMALAGLGPSLAAIIVTRGRVLSELRRGAPPGWLVLSFLLPVALLSVAAGLHALLGGSPALGVPFWGAVLWPPFGEELGWRGHLTPSLERRVGPRLGAVGVGLAWAIWHLPTALAVPARLPLFALGLVAWSFVMAWLRRSGRGSVWTAILAHAGVNAAAGLLPPSDTAGDLLRLALLCTAGAAAFVALPDGQEQVT
jgi:membrane protease YdiL (CAAX protease family)